MTLQGSQHRSAMPDRCGDDGFTLFEMLIVLTLIALLGLLALPLARGTASARGIDTAIRDLARNLAAARSDAMRDAARRSVLIDARNRRWRRDDSVRWTALPPGIGIDVTAPRNAVTSGVTRLSYFHDGSASGGTIRLRHGARRRAIAIDWLSGRLTLRDGG